MAKNLKVIRQLLPFLRTELVKQAQHQLVELCKKEKGLKHLISLVYDQSLIVEERMSAASHLNRMFIQYSQCYKDDTIEDGLTFIFGDLTVPYKVKSMLVGYASIRLRQDSEKMYFVKILLGIVEDILMQMEHLFQGKGPINKKCDSWLTMKDEVHVINGCYTVILIGHVIFALVGNLKNEKQVTKYLKYILKFVEYCGKLHLRIFFPKIITKYPDIFQKLFKLYELLSMQGANEEISHACFKLITEWAHLADDFRQAYLAYDKPELQSDKGQPISQGKLALIAFHWDALYHLNAADQSQNVHLLLDDFVPTIKQTALTMISFLDFGEKINYAADMLYILQFSYERQLKMDIKSMIADFQSLILPIIVHEIALYRVQLFESSPSKMYEKLCQVIEYPQQSQQILNPVTAITKHLISVSEDFYLYLFQIFRYSMETLLKFENIDDWQPPYYLLNKQPMELSVVFYIMSFMPYQNTFSPEIIKYLKSIITFQLVDKLDQLELAMFYFFLENTWFQLYDEQLSEAKYLLYFAFKTKVNPSAKHFIYQFINTFSDYSIDKDFILAYTRKLPLLHQCRGKWRNMFNWLSLSNSFEEEYVLELVHIIQGHLHDDRLKSAEELKYYGKMFNIFDQRLKQMEDEIIQQVTLLSQQIFLKAKENKEESMSNVNQEQSQNRMLENQEEDYDEVCTKRKQSIYEIFTKRLKKDQDWNMEQMTQSQKEDHPLLELFSRQQMQKKVSEISAKVSKLSLQ